MMLNVLPMPGSPKVIALLGGRSFRSVFRRSDRGVRWPMTWSSPSLGFSSAVLVKPRSPSLAVSDSATLYLSLRLSPMVCSPDCPQGIVVGDGVLLYKDFPLVVTVAESFFIWIPYGLKDVPF